MKYKIILFLKFLRTKPREALSFFYQNLYRKTLILNINGRKFYQNNDQSTLYHLLNSYPKLKKMVSYIPEDVDGGVIVDGGANNGLYSFLVAQRFPRVRIIACEPSSTLQGVLEKNFSDLNIKLIAKALSDKTEKLSLYTSKDSDQIGSTIKENVEAFKKSGLETTLVDGISLEDLMISENIQKISLLKLDVQGAEYNILKDADSVLDRTDYLMLEVMLIEPSAFDLIQLIRVKFPFYTVINKVSYGADILFSKKELKPKHA